MNIDMIDELLKRYPELKSICDSKAQYGAAMAKLIFENDDQIRQKRLRDLEEEYHFIELKEKEFCKANGIPLDYAAPEYSCRLCQDRGWLFYDTVTGRLELCKCGLEKRHQRLFSLSGLSDIERTKTFDTFSVSYYGDAAEQERAKRLQKRCERFAADIVEDKPNVMGIGLVGNVGRGKTHLLLSIFNYIVTRAPQLSPLYCVAADLLDDLRAGYDTGAEVTYNEKVKAIVESDLLIIDDLGAEKWTGWVENTLFKLINGRLVRNKPIAFSTNLPMEELCMIVGERIFSRIYSSCEILSINGKNDIRMMRKFEVLRIE